MNTNIETTDGTIVSGTAATKYAEAVKITARRDIPETSRMNAHRIELEYRPAQVVLTDGLVVELPRRIIGRIFENVGSERYRDGNKYETRLDSLEDIARLTTAGVARSLVASIKGELA